MSETRSRSAFIPLLFVVGGGAAVFLSVWIIPGLLRPDRKPNERGWSYSLKTVATAQCDFRANDRDGNGIQDFWRDDIAGLYAVTGTDGKPIKLIPLSGALADDRPNADLSSLGTKAPINGYWYRAIGHEDERSPNPARFAICAFPADYGREHAHTFIIDEQNMLWHRDLGHGRGVEFYPKDPAAGGWVRIE